MFCKYCGKVIDSDTVFCPSCGKNQTKINNETTQQKTQTAESDRKSVGFFDAVKNYYMNYTYFDGRAVRSEFLWCVLYECLFSLVVRYVLFRDIAISDFRDFSRLLAYDEYLAIFYIVASLANILPGISLRIRRLHDVGKSGWNYLWNLVPIVGSIVLLVYLFKDSSYSDNEWGKSPYSTTPEHEEGKPWRCEKCGCLTPNSRLFCKACGAFKPSSGTVVPPTPYQKSTRCVCGELFYEKTCPNCGRPKSENSN